MSSFLPDEKRGIDNGQNQLEIWKNSYQYFNVSSSIQRDGNPNNMDFVTQK